MVTPECCLESPMGLPGERAVEVKLFAYWTGQLFADMGVGQPLLANRRLSDSVSSSGGGVREPVEQAVWDRAVAQTRYLLGDLAAAEAFEHGKTLPPEQAAVYALAEE